MQIREGGSVEEAAGGCGGDRRKRGGKDEYELAGVLQGESVKLVKCPGINVEVPADAEILIEGNLRPERVKDGPYFDYAGKATANPKAFLFEATRMMYQDRVIFRGSSIGHRRAENLQVFAVLSEVGLFDFHGSRLRRALQIFLLREGWLRAFQLSGRMGWEC